MGSKSLWDIRPYRETMAAFERAASLGGDRSLSVISAVGGSGKSYCAQRFAQERREHVLVEVPCRALIERSVRVLLDIIAANLAVRSTGNTSRLEIADRIAVNLRKRGGMLMVDEADQLLVRYVDVLRRYTGSQRSGRHASGISVSDQPGDGGGSVGDVSEDVLEGGV